MMELICPRCKQPLKILPDNSEALCVACQARYPKKRRAWDFRVILEDKDLRWSAENFDLAYEKEGGYHEGHEHAARMGIPEFIENYRISRVKDTVAAWISKKAQSRLLDVGCGNGWYDFHLKEKWNYQGEMVGVDISPFRINVFLEEILKRGHDRMSAFSSNGEGLPFPDASFDQVVMTEVLEHVESPQKTIQEIARILKSGGDFFITTPSGPMCAFWDGLFYLPRKIRRWWKKSKPVDSGNYVYDVPLSKKQILAITQEAGLKLVHYHKSVFLPHESYLQFFPKFMLRLMLIKAYALEALGPLTNFLGLHHMIHLQKP